MRIDLERKLNGHDGDDFSSHLSEFGIRKRLFSLQGCQRRERSFTCKLLYPLLIGISKCRCSHDGDLCSWCHLTQVLIVMHLKKIPCQQVLMRRNTTNPTRLQVSLGKSGDVKLYRKGNGAGLSRECHLAALLNLCRDHARTLFVLIYKF